MKPLAVFVNALIGFVLFAFLHYCATSFVYLEFDFRLWGDGQRFSLVVCSIIGAVLLPVLVATAKS